MVKFTGLNELNNYLADASYIVGFLPTQADVAIFKAVGAAPEAATYPHAARWFSHIASFAAEEQAAFAAGSAEYVAAAPKAAAAEEEDDDLFGDDDEEAEKRAAELAAQRKAAVAAKPKPVAKSSILLDIKGWSDETDMKELEGLVRGLNIAGLTWGCLQAPPRRLRRQEAPDHGHRSR
eukprot:TRINITY_DN128_c0_g1_i2.p1 TRINITY_DN128_c0_g1~~TRINITY_DN128_c0_g1_i2.p1  ORF type:complete len:208 (+),score=126.05 TRINITY_DN128_c0_g1_i2:88-624(+)